MRWGRRTSNRPHRIDARASGSRARRLAAARTGPRAEQNSTGQSLLSMSSRQCRACSRLVPKARLFIAAVAIEGRNQTEVAEA